MTINEAFAASTSDGERISGVLHRPDGSASSRGSVVVAHPHPSYGGDMWNPVVDAVCRTAVELGWSALRFDFRGVGDSSGRHDGGRGERLDVAAVVEHADRLAPESAIVLAGYSFGAITALGVAHPRIESWLAIAPPLGDEDPPAAADARPKVLLVPAHDQFCPPEKARRATTWVSTTIEIVPGADHFLNGRLSVVAGATERLLELSR